MALCGRWLSNWSSNWSFARTTCPRSLGLEGHLRPLHCATLNWFQQGVRYTSTTFNIMFYLNRAQILSDSRNLKSCRWPKVPDVQWWTAWIHCLSAHYGSVHHSTRTQFMYVCVRVTPNCPLNFFEETFAFISVKNLCVHNINNVYEKSVSALDWPFFFYMWHPSTKLWSKTILFVCAETAVVPSVSQCEGRLTPSTGVQFSAGPYGNTHAFRQFRVSNSPHIHVFGQLEELKILENPADSEDMRTIKSATFCQWGGTAKRYTAMTPRV